MYYCSLRQIDLEFMRRMHRKVNIVPVIAKADTLTSTEIRKLKDRIMADIEDHKIQVKLKASCGSSSDTFGPHL